MLISIRPKSTIGKKWILWLSVDTAIAAPLAGCPHEACGAAAGLSETARRKKARSDGLGRIDESAPDRASARNICTQRPNVLIISSAVRGKHLNNMCHSLCKEHACLSSR